jgi:TonB family protein
MITHDPIVADSDATEHFPVSSIPVPTFATLDSRRSVSSSAGSSGGRSWGKTIAALVILGIAGYLAWQNIQPLQYLPGSPTLQKVVKQVAAPAASPAPASSAPTSVAPSTSSTAGADNGSPLATSSDASSNATSEATPAASDAVGVTNSSPATAVAASGAPARSSPGTIRVQEMPMNLDQRTRLAAKPQPNGAQQGVASQNMAQQNAAQPIVVKPGTAEKKPGSQAAKPQQAQPAPPVLTLTAMNTSNATLASIVSTNAAKPALGSFRISQGVSQGLLIKKVAPVYSPTALQLHKEGAVDLMATVSTGGAVTSVQVVKGDLLLAKSAVDAVKQWKYRPYLLNGEPVEIQTQITVNFKMPQ